MTTPVACVDSLWGVGVRKSLIFFSFLEVKNDRIWHKVFKIQILFQSNLENFGTLSPHSNKLGHTAHPLGDSWQTEK